MTSPAADMSLVERLRLNACRLSHESQDEFPRRRIKVELEAADKIEQLESRALAAEAELLDTKPRTVARCAAVAFERALKLRAKAKDQNLPISDAGRQSYFAQAIEARVIADKICALAKEDGK